MAFPLMHFVSVFMIPLWQGADRTGKRAKEYGRLNTR